MRSVQSQIEQYVAVGRAGAAGGGRGRPQHHRARAARRHGGVQPGHEHRAAPGAPRDGRTSSSASGSSSGFLARQIEILELKGKIQSEVKSEMDKTQREYILREQLKAIQRELGEDDPQQAEINELREKVEAGRHAGRGQGPGDQGDRPDEPDPVGLPGGRRDPHLRGLAGRAALERLDGRQPRHQAGRGASSTRTTTAWRRSRNGSSSTWRSAPWRAPSGARSWPSWDRPAWARPRSARASRGPWAASSCA